MADVVGKDDVIARGVEEPAGREEHVGELRPEELMPVAARAVHDEHGVGHMAFGVADGRAQRRVMDADLVHRLAGPEVEIVGEEIALLGGRFRERGACRQQSGRQAAQRRLHGNLPLWLGGLLQVWVPRQTRTPAIFPSVYNAVGLCPTNPRYLLVSAGICGQRAGRPGFFGRCLGRGFMKRICVLAAAVLAASQACLAADVLPPPPTPAGATVDTIQGVRIADPYRWLEDWNDPKVQAWSNAQNMRARAYLDALPDRGTVKTELSRLINETSPAYTRLSAKGPFVFALYTDASKQQPMLVTMNANADPATRRIVLDPNQIDAKGLTAIDWFVASPDGKRVAVSLSKNGSEDGTLHVYDVASGQEIDSAHPARAVPDCRR